MRFTTHGETVELDELFEGDVFALDDAWFTLTYMCFAGAAEAVCWRVGPRAEEAPVPYRPGQLVTLSRDERVVYIGDQHSLMQEAGK